MIQITSDLPKSGVNTWCCHTTRPKPSPCSCSANTSAPRPRCHPGSPVAAGVPRRTKAAAAAAQGSARIGAHARDEPHGMAPGHAGSGVSLTPGTHLSVGWGEPLPRGAAGSATERGKGSRKGGAAGMGRFRPASPLHEPRSSLPATWSRANLFPEPPDRAGLRAAGRADPISRAGPLWAA